MMQYISTVCSVCGIADREVGGPFTAHAACDRLRYGRWYERIGQAIINTVSYAYFRIKGLIADA